MCNFGVLVVKNCIFYIDISIKYEYNIYEFKKGASKKDKI